MWLFGGFIYLKAQWHMGQYSLVFAERYSIYKHKQKTSIFIKLKFFIPLLWVQGSPASFSPVVFVF